VLRARSPPLTSNDEIARQVDLKAENFAETLDNWLGLFFIPASKLAIKALKAKGVKGE
jgi:hypothetical protein